MSTSTERMRRWRKLNPIKNQKQNIKNSKKYRATDKGKIRNAARMKVTHALENGTMRRRNSCEICHSNNTHFHHDDYSKPLDVIELCIRCHSLLHKQYRDKGIVI